MALENFDLIVERAKLSGKKNRVVIAGADAENILLGTFEAQEAGFAPQYWWEKRTRSCPCWSAWG